MSGFPLTASVAVVGSRYGSPYWPARLAAAVVLAGGSVVTGCAAGVDHAAATAAAGAGRAAVVFRTAGPLPYQLAARTVQVIHHAAAVAVFPPAGGQLGRGSALALRTAQARRLPVFVAGPVQPAPQFTPATVAGVAGWLWLPPMPSLF